MLLRPARSSSLDPSPERYVLRGNGPPVAAVEVEHAERLAIEVVVVWGADVLCVSHFAVPSAVFVGGAGSAVALPAELLGAERRCVAVSSRSDVCAVLPAGVRGRLTLPDGSARPFEALSELHGEPPELMERLLPLALGHRAHLCFESLEVQVATVRLGRRCPRALDVDVSVLSSLGLTALTAASLMAVLSRLTPALGLNHDEQAETARVRLLHTYLDAATAREAQPRTDNRHGPSRAAGLKKPPARRSTPGEAAANDADIEPPPVTVAESLLGLEGNAMRTRDPIERRGQIEAARKFGVVGMLAWPELSDPKFRFERTMSGEELAMMQRLFNPDAPPVYQGPGGLALSSTGIGGGGKADVIELGAVRTAAEGQGEALARLPGLTRAAIEPEAHTARSLPARERESITSDPLAAASIRRAVHAERAALRDCYRNALPGDSAVATSATVRFLVLGNGRIDRVSASHPTLPGNVSTCIERVFLGLSVPNPVSRPVHVAYRVALDS